LPVRRNIYPVPDSRFPWLGVHFTPTISGDLLMGPSAVLALAREGYNMEFNPKDLLDYSNYKGFHNFLLKNFPFVLRECYKALNPRVIVRELQKYVPSLNQDDVTFAKVGIRALAMHENGQIEDDFCIQKDGCFVHIRNAPSPACTASLEIARKIIDEMI